MLKKIVMMNSKDLPKTIERLKKNIQTKTGKNFRVVPSTDHTNPELVQNVHDLCTNLVRRHGENRLRGWHFTASVEEIKTLANTDPEEIVLVKAPPEDCIIYGYKTIADEPDIAVVNINENIEINTLTEEDYLMGGEGNRIIEDPFEAYQRMNCNMNFWNILKLIVWLFILCMLGFIVFSSSAPSSPKLIEVHPLTPIDDFFTTVEPYLANSTNITTTEVFYKLEIQNSSDMSLDDVPSKILNSSNQISYFFGFEWKQILLIAVTFYALTYYLQLAILRAQ